MNVKSKVRLFADDTDLYLPQKDLDNPEHWSHKWDMAVNIVFNACKPVMKSFKLKCR